MKRPIIALLSGIAVMGLALPAAAQNINERQYRQQERIDRGYERGDLTRHEARRLTKQQQRIARVEHHDRRDGRALSWRERQRLNDRQNRVSADISHARHDNDYRHY